MLADALRLGGHGGRRLYAQDPIVFESRILHRDEVALIEERTGLINQIQQALHAYLPSTVEASKSRLKRLRLAYDTRLLDEYREVLRRPKFDLPSASVQRFLSVMSDQEHGIFF